MISPLRVVQSGGDGRSLTEIPSKNNDVNVLGLARRQLPQDAQAGIGAAVIDEDCLPRPVKRRHGRGDLVEQDRKIPLFVIDWND